MTEAQFNTFVKNQLRGASWKWKSVSEAKNKQKLARNTYVCEGCRQTFGSKDVVVDHKTPVVDVYSEKINWDEFINRLFCELENLQLLCKTCHLSKTKEEDSLRKDVRNWAKTFPKEYSVWRGMYRRCLEPQNQSYERYGGKGVTVCDRWNPYVSPKEGFKNFFEDLGPVPEDYTLERLDSRLGYFPENCVWASYEQQNNNRPGYNRILSYGDQTDTLANFAKKWGLNYTTLDERLKRGWELEKALTTPVRSSKNNKKDTNELSNI